MLWQCDCIKNLTVSLYDYTSWHYDIMTSCNMILWLYHNMTVYHDFLFYDCVMTSWLLHYTTTSLRCHIMMLSYHDCVIHDVMTTWHPTTFCCHGYIILLWQCNDETTVGVLLISWCYCMTRLNYIESSTAQLLADGIFFAAGLDMGVYTMCFNARKMCAMEDSTSVAQVFIAAGVLNIFSAVCNAHKAVCAILVSASNP